MIRTGSRAEVQTHRRRPQPKVPPPPGRLPRKLKSRAASELLGTLAAARMPEAQRLGPGWPAVADASDNETRRKCWGCAQCPTVLLYF